MQFTCFQLFHEKFSNSRKILSKIFHKQPPQTVFTFLLFQKDWTQVSLRTIEKLVAVFNQMICIFFVCCGEDWMSNAAVLRAYSRPIWQTMCGAGDLIWVGQSQGKCVTCCVITLDPSYKLQVQSPKLTSNFESRKLDAYC